MDIEDLKRKVSSTIDKWYSDQGVTIEKAHRLDEAKEAIEEFAPEAAGDKPEGKRAVRTSVGGDRVYLLDDVKKTRQWVTNPEVLKSHGFELSDVVEIDEDEMLKYQMAPALYRVDED